MPKDQKNTKTKTNHTEPPETQKYQQTNWTGNVLLCVIYAAYQHSQFGLSFGILCFLLVFIGFLGFLWFLCQLFWSSGTNLPLGFCSFPKLIFGFSFSPLSFQITHFSSLAYKKKHSDSGVDCLTAKYLQLIGVKKT